MKDNAYKYNDTLKPGDLITTYFKGYFTFIEYKPRGKCSPIVRFKLVADSNGNLRKGTKVMECDACYCELATEHIKKAIEDRKTEIVKLGALLK